MTGYVLAAALAFVVAGAMVPLLVRFAVGRDLLDVPNDRSSHEEPTPRLGGVAVIVACWVGVAVFGAGEWFPLLVGATLVGAVGLADDFLNLHFGVKALAQVVVATALLAVYPPDAISESPGLLAVPIAAAGVLWVAAVCNAFNFMDGIDGITGGVALVVAVFLFVMTGTVGGSLLPAFAGAVAGFLVWNISPASIFMGDAGSYFIGFLLAASALYIPMDGSWSLVPLFACLLVFTPYLMDTAFTILRRLRRGAGRRVFSAHREHIYQRITPDASMHRRTSNLYYGLSVAAGAAGIAAFSGGVMVVVGLVVAILCCVIMFALPKVLGDTVR